MNKGVFVLVDILSEKFMNSIPSLESDFLA